MVKMGRYHDEPIRLLRPLDVSHDVRSRPGPVVGLKLEGIEVSALIHGERQRPIDVRDVVPRLPISLGSDQPAFERVRG